MTYEITYEITQQGFEDLNGFCDVARQSRKSTVRPLV